VNKGRDVEYFWLCFLCYDCYKRRLCRNGGMFSAEEKREDFRFTLLMSNIFYLPMVFLL
jgi:hypothetical protein